MYMLSEDVMTFLYGNGWTPERRINVDAYESYFIETQQPYSDVVLEFLSSFGGIEIKRPASEFPDISFNPIEAGSDLGMDDLKDYSENWIHKPLCAVGHLRHHDIILMTPTGECYSAFDWWVVKFGNTVTESVENLCLKRFLERISRN